MLGLVVVTRQLERSRSAISFLRWSCSRLVLCSCLARFCWRWRVCRWLAGRWLLPALLPRPGRHFWAAPAWPRAPAPAPPSAGGSRRRRSLADELDSELVVRSLAVLGQRCTIGRETKKRATRIACAGPAGRAPGHAHLPQLRDAIRLGLPTVSDSIEGWLQRGAPLCSSR